METLLKSIKQSEKYRKHVGRRSEACNFSMGTLATLGNDKLLGMLDVPA